MPILLITGPQGSRKSALANFIEELAQDGKRELLLCDPFIPDVDDLDYILEFADRGWYAVLVANDLGLDAGDDYVSRRATLDEILQRALRVTLTGEG